jgi:hypothetical protein
MVTLDTKAKIKELMRIWKKHPELNVRACFVMEQRDPPSDPEASAEAMARILAATPKLSITGFSLEPLGMRIKNGLRHADVYPEAFRAQRDAMLLPGALNGFEAARAWLRPYHKTRACHVSARALKHDAADDGVGYVTAGVFIAAALAEGFRVKRRNVGSDGLININEDELFTRAMKRLNERHPALRATA